jgi:hypothetical protein
MHKKWAVYVREKSTKIERSKLVVKKVPEKFDEFN